MKYKFPEKLYPSDIMYHYSKSVFNFFNDKRQTKEFFKYLFFRLEHEHKKRLKGEKVCAVVLRNENDKYNLIDLNYNFFIHVLGEWIEHYSHKKETLYEFKRFKTFDSKDKDDNEISIRKFRELKLKCSICERVEMDFAYSGWMTRSRNCKNFRFDLLQVLMNNILGKHVYVANYTNRAFAKTTPINLVKDVRTDEYISFVSVSFFRPTLLNYLTKNQMKKLREMESELEKIAGTKNAIEKKISALGLQKDELKSCNYIDTERLEKLNDFGDGKYHLFEEKPEDFDEFFEVEN